MYTPNKHRCELHVWIVCESLCKMDVRSNVDLVESCEALGQVLVWRYSRASRCDTRGGFHKGSPNLGLTLWNPPQMFMFLHACMFLRALLRISIENFDRLHEGALFITDAVCGSSIYVQPTVLLTIITYLILIVTVHVVYCHHASNGLLWVRVRFWISLCIQFVCVTSFHSNFGQTIETN